MVDKRIDKLTQEGLLEARGQQRIVTDKGRKILTVFRNAQIFFGHQSSIEAPRSSKACS